MAAFDCQEITECKRITYLLTLYGNVFSSINLYVCL